MFWEMHARKIPREVAAKRCRATPIRNSITDPSTGTSMKMRITKIRENADAVSTISIMDQILDAMISNAVTGMTRRCSRVPFSRSRISAEPVRMIASIVILFTSCMTEVNHSCVRFGLKRLRITYLANVEFCSFFMNREISC